MLPVVVAAAAVSSLSLLLFIDLVGFSAAYTVMNFHLLASPLSHADRSLVLIARGLSHLSLLRIKRRTSTTVTATELQATKVLSLDRTSSLFKISVSIWANLSVLNDIINTQAAQLITVVDATIPHRHPTTVHHQPSEVRITFFSY